MHDFWKNYNKLSFDANDQMPKQPHISQMRYKTTFINEMYFLLDIFRNVEKVYDILLTILEMNDSSDIIKCPTGFTKTLYLIQVSNIVLSLKLQLSSLFVYGFAQSHHFKKEQIICLEFG